MFSSKILSDIKRMWEEYTRESGLSEGSLYVANTLRSNGFQALIAGGYVRDSVLGRDSKDIDFVTDATPDEVEKIFEKTIPLGKSYGVIVVVAPNGEQFEVATFREDSKTGDGRRPDSVEFKKDPKSDASRRDLTMNAMFLDPLEGHIHDFYGGKEDIEQKRVNTVGDPIERFNEDYLRMLRAVRFATVFNFRIENNVLDAIKKLALHINEISAERINKELIKILSSDNPRRGIELLDESGLLREIIPEVYNLKGVKQSEVYHPEGDAYIHTLIVVEKLAGNPYQIVLAGLLHDIGKPKTSLINSKTGKIQSIGHDSEGAIMAEVIMRRLKFTLKDMKEVVFCVQNHMRMNVFRKMRVSKKRILAESEYFDSLYKLSLADIGSTGSDTKEIEDDVSKILAMPKEEKLINGDDLISIGIKNKKSYGKILRKIRELQLEGKVRDKDQALKIAKGMKDI